MVDYFESYSSGQLPASSLWIDCSCWSSYYYYVRNTGSGTIVVTTELSPNMGLIYQDIGPMEIEPGQTELLVPNRDSRYLRVSFVNKSGDLPNRLIIWFQAKR